MLTNGLMDLKFWTCFPEVHDLKFGRASQRSMDFNLDTLPRGPMDWNLGRASKRSED